METIKYATYYTEIKGFCVDTLKFLKENNINTDKDEVLTDVIAELDSETYKLKIAIIGEFSAGKTTIINALAGMELVTGTGVVTQESVRIPWEGVVLIDTPGLESSQSTNLHDKISYDETIAADLVLFVISNELFRPSIANYLRKIVHEGKLDDNDEGLGLNAKTAVIVNKMDRVLEKDGEIRKDNILKGVQKVTHPYNIPIYLCSADEYLEALKSSSDESDEDVEQFKELIKNINEFIRFNGLTGRLQTPIQICIAALEEARMDLDDPKIRKEIEKIQLFKKKMELMINEYNKDIIQNGREIVFNKVIEKGETYLNQIGEGMTVGIFDSIIEDINIEAGNIYNDLFDKSRKLAIEKIEKIHLQFDSIEIPSEIIEKIISSNPEFSNFEKPKIEEKIKNISPALKHLSNGALDAIKDITKQGAADVNALKGFIKSVKNVKFKPWQLSKEATKWAGRLGKASKAIPFLAFGIDIIINYREEKENESLQKYYASCRTALRGYLREVGAGYRDKLQDVFIDVRRKSLDEIALKFRNAEDQYRAQNSSNSALTENANRILKSLKQLHGVIAKVDK